MPSPCPITGQPMQRVEVHGVTADLSPSHGLWLDHGELFLITEDARHDEGGFWETGDRAALEAKMRLLNEKMDELAMDLNAESLGDLSGLSAEDIASRIEDFLKGRQ